MVMRDLIMKEDHEFMSKAKDKEFDPMSLKNKCNYISGGFLDQSKEKSVVRRNVSNATKMTSERMQVYSSFMIRLSTSCQILELTTDQWKTMMRKNYTWMGNVLMGDDCTRVDDYSALDEKHLKIMLHALYGV